MGEKFIAPDGGWGWVVMAAFAISNIILIPALQSFGLLYRNVFEELEMSATDISTIINVNSAFGLVLGLFIGPLQKVYGYRKVAMGGSLLAFLGYALCSTAYSFKEFIMYYGIINSMGVNATIASYALALNTYFNRRRNLASGLCTAFTGLGPVFMPQVISLLIHVYAVRGTALILSALILHSFAGSLLLQPVSWHTKKDTDEEKDKELELLNPDEKLKIIIDDEKNELQEADVPEDYDCQSVHGVEGGMIPTKPTENGFRGLNASMLSLTERNLSPDSTWWRRASNTAPRLSISHSVHSVLSCKNEKKKSESFTSKIVKLFDFDLLKDAGYRNIWIGMSLAFTGEINFSLMTPLILGDKGMNIEQTAQLMSSIAITDIIFRFITPFIGDWLKWTPKNMYLSSLVCLVLTRTTLTMVHGYKQILAACLIIGVAKGLRTVYMSLVIPSSVPLERLPSASGLQTVLNGVLLMFVGPGLGYLRDTVGNYDICIHVINGFSTVTIILWTTELLLSLRKPKSNKQVEEPPES